MLPNRLRGVQHCGTSSPPFLALRNANLPAPRQVQKHLGTPKIPLMPMHTDPNLWPGHWAYLPHSKRKSVISKCNGLGMGESEMELKKKKSKWDYSKGGLYFYYTGARRQCASSALIHNKSAKLLLSLETKIAVALKTHWKHLLSSLFFFFPLLILVQKWYKQQYKIFVLLTVTKNGFWTRLTDANCFCASAWIQQNSRSLPREQPQSCGLLHSFSIVKGNMQNHN